MTITDLDTSQQANHHYNGSTQTAITEFVFDLEAPLHCSVGGSRRCTASEELFDIGPAVIRNGSFTSVWGGWSDTPAQVSSYTLELYRIEKRGSFACESPSSRQELVKVAASSVQGIARFPVQLNVSAAYSLILAVTDDAGNVRYARRSLLFDDRSTIEINTARPLRVSSAWHSMVDGRAVAWQQHRTDSINIDGVGHFYNTLLVSSGWLQPLCNFSGGIISEYDQPLTGGLLPRAGTHSSEGVTEMYYAVTVNPSDPTLPPPASDFKPSSNVAVANLSVNALRNDSDQITVWLRAHDIHGQPRMDSVSLLVDSSPPTLSGLSLRTADGTLLSLFGSRDFRDLRFQFQTQDQHSGLDTVTWAIGMAIGASDIGQGRIPLPLSTPVSVK